MSIGQRIQELRKEHSYSQEYVAERLNVSRQAISKWENDISAPDTCNLIALAELFDVSVEYIATGKQNSPPPAVPTEEKIQNKITSQKILGFIFLGTGIFSLILGTLFSEVLVLLSVYLLTGAILCLTARKKLWFSAMWTFLILTFLIFSILTSQNLFIIFQPESYQDEISIGLIVSALYQISLILAITVTMIRIIKKYRK